MVKNNPCVAVLSEQNQVMRCGICVHTGLQSGLALGDGVAAVTHYMGLDRMAVMYSDVTGKDCGCKNRQILLNKAVPDIRMV